MKKEYIYLFGLLFLLVVIFRKKINLGVTTIAKNLPRGLRNNNPGNIRKTSEFWQGETVGQDKSFKTFINMAYGYRAIFVLLRSYITKGYDTIEKIINRYAPPVENKTSSYIKHVAERTGISPTKKLSFNDSEAMKKIVAAISKSENGIDAELTEIEKGYNLI